jgi:hypothetical protein
MWNLEALREHLRRLDRQHHLLEVVDSIGRSTALFHFHLFSARDALEGIIDDDQPAGIENLKLVFGASDNQDDYNRARLASEAHVIASLQTVRNEFDIFSQLANGLLLADPLPVSKCDITRVHAKMPPSDLSRRLDEVIASYWFLYVVGFINTAKHRKLVQHIFSVSFEDNAAGIQVGEFEYEGRSYPKLWVREVLEGAVEAHNAMVDCGRKLNDLCGVSDDA